MAAITTKAQARKAANEVADLLWAAYQSGEISFEQTESLTPRCIDLVFDLGLSPKGAVDKVLVEVFIEGGLAR